MSSTFHHFWHLNQNYNPGYYQAPPNYNTGHYHYYVSRNIAEDPYLRDFYVIVTNYYHIDDHHVYVAPNSQSHYTYNGQSSFAPYMWEVMGEFIDNVYVTNERGFIHHHQPQVNNHYVSRNIGDHYFAPHYSAFTYNGHYLWGDAYNQPTGEFINRVINDDANDYIAYLESLISIEGNEEAEATEEVVANLMKIRTRCTTDDGEEICVICQCEYENDETIGTLHCQHEYHAGCIKEWLMKGKRSCPICRSSVLPS